MIITVLICCSDTRRRNKLTSLLLQMGLTIVAESSDAQQALRMARSAHPRLVIVDVDPFDRSALDMAALMAKEKLAPVVLITAPHHQEVMSAINEDYVISYIIKPINRWALESAINSALATFRKMEQMESEINKLKETLDTRKLVERAKYILMAELGITEPEAFRRLQKQSMDKGIAMKSLAEAIILNEDLKKGN